MLNRVYVRCPATPMPCEECVAPHTLLVQWQAVVTTSLSGMDY